MGYQIVEMGEKADDVVLAFTRWCGGSQRVDTFP